MWTVLIPIIAQYGLPFAEALIQKWESGAAPTAADFVALRALAATSAGSLAKAQIAASPLAGTAAGVVLQNLTGN